MRLVVSLTTLPDRIYKLRKTLDSIQNQTRKPDKIYLNIPFKTLKGKTYRIPKFISNNQNITIVRCEDHGPITKLLPILDIETDPNTYIVTFDDDTIIDKHVLKIFEHRAKKYPNSVLSFSGWCVCSPPMFIQFYNVSNRDIEVDWVQGCHGIMYPRGLLDMKEINKFSTSLPKFTIYHDDHVISGYLSSKNIKKIVLKEDAYKYFTRCDYYCISAISKRLGFKVQVITICLLFMKRGLYFHDPHRWTNVFILALILFSLRKTNRVFMFTFILFSRLIIPLIRYLIF